MDQHRFDEVTRIFGTDAPSRRSLLRAILGSTGAGLLALLLPGGRAEARRDEEKKQGRNKKRRRGNRRRPAPRRPNPPTLPPPDGPAVDPRCPNGKPFVSNVFCPEVFEAVCSGLDVCAKDADGNRRCVVVAGADCAAESDCRQNADCATGHVCVEIGGCCNQPRTFCRPIVPETASGRTRS